MMTSLPGLEMRFKEQFHITWNDKGTNKDRCLEMCRGIIYRKVRLAEHVAVSLKI